jgi:two-component system, OmpR family, response regulator
MRILFVVERTLAEAMQPVFEEDGFLDVVHSAEARAPATEYGAVLLDQSVVKSQCNDYLLRWRRDGLQAHVLVLLPRESTSAERAACLDAGADAYLLRPLSVEELRAHLGVLRRRDRVASAIRRVHDLEINTTIGTVMRAGQPIHLTPREFELLQFLAHHQGRVVSRTIIRKYLYNGRGNNFSNVVDVYVRYLRIKIDKGFATPLILTRWGQGYLLRGENG